jgi:hypothetical protein
MSQAAASRARAGRAAALNYRVVVERALLGRSTKPVADPYALPATYGPVPHPIDEPLEWMRRDASLQRAAVGHSEPEATTDVAAYARVDWLTIVGALRPGAYPAFVAVLKRLGGAPHLCPDRPAKQSPYRWTATLSCGLQVNFVPRYGRRTPDVKIDFTGRELEKGLASDAYRRAIAPLLVDASIQCSRVDIAVDYAVSPLRVLPVGLSHHALKPRARRTYRPDRRREGYEWPALHSGRVPNVVIGLPRSSVRWTIYDKTARVADGFWENRRWCPMHFEPVPVGEDEWRTADLSDAMCLLRRSTYAAWPIPEAVRRHQQVTRIEARVRPRASTSRSPVGLIARLSNPFGHLGLIDLLHVKKHDERWWPVLLQARLTSLEEVEECLATFGLSRTEVHGRLCAFAALPAHGGLLSPAAVFERERGAIQRQLDEIVGPINLADSPGLAAPMPRRAPSPADATPMLAHGSSGPTPPMRPLPVLVAGTVLIDNRSKGTRLVVVASVANDRVEATDLRTGRRLLFHLAQVGPRPAAFTVVLPHEVEAAARPLYVTTVSPPMPSPGPRSPIAAGTLLRDNRSRGARLVVVAHVDGDRVRGYDQRTGRRTSFRLTSVGSTSSPFTVVPPEKADEARRRMRDLRLGALGANVMHLSDHRGRQDAPHQGASLTAPFNVTSPDRGDPMAQERLPPRPPAPVTPVQ